MTIGIVERRGIGYSRGRVAHNPKPKTKDEDLRYPERGGAPENKTMGGKWATQSTVLPASGGENVGWRACVVVVEREMVIGRASIRKLHFS